MAIGHSTHSLSVFAVWLLFVTAGAIPQRPPNYHHDHMPNTSFTCAGKVVGGYYADPEAYCQMFHVCVQVDENDIRDFRFMCPDDTVFDQENFICANWFEIDCKSSTFYYDKNLNLFHPDDETKSALKGNAKNPAVNQEDISEQLRRQQDQQKQQLLLLEQQQQQLLYRQQQILERHEKQQQEHQQKQLKIVEDQQRQQLALRPPEGRKVPAASAGNVNKAQQGPTTAKPQEYEETTVEYDYYYYDYEDDTTEQQGKFFINDEYDPNTPGRLVEPTNARLPVLPLPLTNSRGSTKPSGNTRKSRR